MNHAAASHKVSSGPFTCSVLLSGAANLLRCALTDLPCTCSVLLSGGARLLCMSSDRSLLPLSSIQVSDQVVVSAHPDTFLSSRTCPTIGEIPDQRNDVMVDPFAGIITPAIGRSGSFGGLSLPGSSSSIQNTAFQQRQTSELQASQDMENDRRRVGFQQDLRPHPAQVCSQQSVYS